jgi:hypothetical protein
VSKRLPPLIRGNSIARSSSPRSSSSPDDAAAAVERHVDREVGAAA